MRALAGLATPTTSGPREFSAAEVAELRAIIAGDWPQSTEAAIRQAYRDLAARAGQPNVSVAVRSSATAEDLPDAIRDRRYDLIAFVHVLEHTLDPVLSLKNAGALLNAGGIMSIEVPNNACHGARMMGEAWRWLDVPRHLNFFTPDSLAACAEAAGLTVRAVLYRGYVRQFMPDWLVDEARIGAELQGRKASKADIDRQVRHSLRLFARTALAKPAQKYDSVRVLCSRA